MAVAGQSRHSVWGGGRDISIGVNNEFTTFALAGLNAGWCGRFVATQAKDIKSVRLRWSSVSAPGEVTLRIETIDMTTGKPTGTLYDANAVITGIVPAAGVQTYSFGTTPTTNLTAGTMYGVVLLTTTGGTTQTLSYASSQFNASYPGGVLTAADGTVRSNFAEVNNGLPLVSFVMDDDTEDFMGNCPYYTFGTNNIFGTNAAALKFVVPSNVTLNLAGIAAVFTRTGTPAGDLRVRIFDASDNVVADSTVTADLDLLTNVSGRWTRFMFTALVALAGATYRAVFDSASSANSSNCWALRSASILNAAAAPSGFVLSTTADVTGTPIVWTDDSTGLGPGVQLLIDTASAAGGSGGEGPLIGGRLTL